MKRQKHTFSIFGLIAFFIALFSFADVANALDIVLEPSSAQRETGKPVRVQIYADPAVDLISMGVIVSFDPSILQVVEAHKYEEFSNGWIMDADGDPATAPQYTNPPVEIDPAGSVTMIGGRLMGSATTGLSGKVLLGWIVFEAADIGTSNLSVDLAKYHPNDPTDTYDNFVRLSGATGAVDEPTNVPADLGAICVVTDACLSDLNGDGVVNGLDVGVLKQEFLNTGCNDPGVWCKGDLNGDGTVNGLDVGLLKLDFLRTDCLCP